MHDVAFRVKLAKHAVVEPVALHPGPELELVRRHGDEVAGEVVRREGVHAAAAGLRVDLIELVFDDRAGLRAAVSSSLLGPDQRVELPAEHAEFLGIVRRVPWVVDLATKKAVVLPRPDGPVDLVADRLLLGAVGRVFRGILGADRVGALEHHVLEEMADAGDARPLIHAPDPGDPAGGDRVGLVGPRHEQELHAVGERELLHRDLLRVGRDGEQEGDTQAGERGNAHDTDPGGGGGAFIPDGETPRRVVPRERISGRRHRAPTARA